MDKVYVQVSCNDLYQGLEVQDIDLICGCFHAGFAADTDNSLMVTFLMILKMLSARSPSPMPHFPLLGSCPSPIPHLLLVLLPTSFFFGSRVPFKICKQLFAQSLCTEDGGGEGGGGGSWWWWWGCDGGGGEAAILKFGSLATARINIQDLNTADTCWKPY